MTEEEHLTLGVCEDRVVLGCQGLIGADSKLSWKLLTAEEMDRHHRVLLWEWQMRQMMK